MCPFFFRRICCYRVRSTWKSQKDALGIKQVIFSDDDRVGCPSLSPKRIVFRFPMKLFSVSVSQDPCPTKGPKKKQCFFPLVSNLHFPPLREWRSGTGRAPHWSWLVPSTVEGWWPQWPRRGLGSR